MSSGLSQASHRLNEQTHQPTPLPPNHNVITRARALSLSHTHTYTHTPPALSPTTAGRIGVGWNNETPLHRAARLGRDECVAMLLKLGANYRARNERGESAFDVAGMYTEQVRAWGVLGSSSGSSSGGSEVVR